MDILYKGEWELEEEGLFTFSKGKLTGELEYSTGQVTLSLNVSIGQGGFIAIQPNYLSVLT